MKRPTPPSNLWSPECNRSEAWNVQSASFIFLFLSVDELLACFSAFMDNSCYLQNLCAFMNSCRSLPNLEFHLLVQSSDSVSRSKYWSDLLMNTCTQKLAHKILVQMRIFIDLTLLYSFGFDYVGLSLLHEVSLIFQ